MSKMLHLLLKLLDALGDLPPRLLIGHEGLLQFPNVVVIHLLNVVEPLLSSLLLHLEILTEVMAHLLDVMLHVHHDLTLVCYQVILGLGELILPQVEHLLLHGSGHLTGRHLLFMATEPSELGLLILNLHLVNKQLFYKDEVPHGIVFNVPVHHHHPLLILLVLPSSDLDAHMEDVLSLYDLSSTLIQSHFLNFVGIAEGLQYLKGRVKGLEANHQGLVTMVRRARTP